jgi:hypothetical protein
VQSDLFGGQAVAEERVVESSPRLKPGDSWFTLRESRVEVRAGGQYQQGGNQPC